ncbi:plasmid partitioning protein RepB [Methylovirgula sp. 4M-Z18]|uniref:plasmid partitioning protein RepB n=1 Tax=Methylovirgula sp. 4M-Z18 TaxID=2293567 RepID=UPI000E2F578F|nr:plasmid partitioning protein RepB [Methylovirgula sp. 4M-Z18]RFB76724.1 plasmid partitioning protein RepB [Methylovirgula sp. 4M-Z18]
MTKRRDALRELLTPIKSGFSAENSAPRPRPYAASGALQSVNDAIAGLTSEADELRQALASGEKIVELDPREIDASFVRDRLGGFDGPEFEALVESIRESGQILPVMVRPHPKAAGRFQLAFGHRRVAAVKLLGRKVKALVRELTDDELVVAQGNENIERQDLSFIEKAMFASRLEDIGISRTVIMATFGTNSKGVLSEMISLIRKLPVELIEAIGAAPGIGRPRWDVLAAQVALTGHAAWKAVVEAAGFAGLSSVERFEKVCSELREGQSPKRPTIEGGIPWTAIDRSVTVTVKATAKKAVVTYEAKEGLNFANYVAGRLDALFEDFQKSRETSRGE